MRTRTMALTCSLGVVACAAIAFATAPSESLGHETFDRGLGLTGAAACALAILGLFHSSWARAWFVAAAVPAGLLLASRLGGESDGGDATIDLTPYFFPPIMFIFGACAFFVLTFERRRQQ